MKAFLFIYTRLDKFDYRLLYAPDKSFLPSPVREKFIDFAREVVNTDNINNGRILAPRWSMMKENNLVLIGVGCYNNILGVTESANEKRVIRGFFGVVVNSLDNSIGTKLFDLTFYKNIFGRYVSPLWDLQRKDENKTNSVIQEITIDSKECINNANVLMNDSDYLCRVFPEDITPESLFLSAITKNKVDFVLNLNNSEHVLKHSMIAFKNISIIGNDTLFDINLNSNSKINSHSQNDYKQDKKDSPRRNSNSKNEKEQVEIVELIYKRLKQCGYSTKAFLRAFAAKCGYSVHPIEDDAMDTMSHKQIHFNDVDEPYSEIDNSKSIDIFEKNKEDRRKTMSALKEQFRTEEHIKVEQPTSLEEITDSEISKINDLSSDDLDVLGGYKDS